MFVFVALQRRDAENEELRTELDRLRNQLLALKPPRPTRLIAPSSPPRPTTVPKASKPTQDEGMGATKCLQCIADLAEKSKRGPKTKDLNELKRTGLKKRAKESL